VYGQQQKAAWQREIFTWTLCHIQGVKTKGF